MHTRPLLLSSSLSICNFENEWFHFWLIPCRIKVTSNWCFAVFELIRDHFLGLLNLEGSCALVSAQVCMWTIWKLSEGTSYALVWMTSLPWSLRHQLLRFTSQRASRLWQFIVSLNLLAGILIKLHHQLIYLLAMNLLTFLVYFWFKSVFGLFKLMSVLSHLLFLFFLVLHPESISHLKLINFGLFRRHKHVFRHIHAINMAVGSANLQLRVKRTFLVSLVLDLCF